MVGGSIADMTAPLTITVAGVPYPVPSSAADLNWAAQQVALLQAMATAIGAGAPALQAQLDALSAAVYPPDMLLGSNVALSSSTFFSRHVVHTARVLFTDVKVAAATKDITLWTLPAETRVLRVVAAVNQKFIGGALSEVDLKVGRSAGGNEYLLSGDVFTDEVVYGTKYGELGKGIVGANNPAAGSTDFDLVWATPTTLQARFTGVDALLNALTQGDATFYIECCTYEPS